MKYSPEHPISKPYLFTASYSHQLSHKKPHRKVSLLLSSFVLLTNLSHASFSFFFSFIYIVNTVNLSGTVQSFTDTAPSSLYH